MKVGLREKLFAVSALLVLAASGAARLGLGRSLDEAADARLERDAAARVSLAAYELERRGRPLARSPELDTLARELGERAGGRVSMFDPDGRLVSDSVASPREVEELAGPAPQEVQAALVAGEGAARRFSPVAGRELAFVATPVRAGSSLLGAVRVGLTPEPAARVRGGLDRAVLVACLAGLVVAAVLSSLAARLATSGVRDLAVLARRMAGGDLEARARPLGEDDLADLGRSLEQLADGLKSSLRQLVGERDLLSGILTGMREGVLLVDDEGRIALQNPALREMLLSSAEDVGKLPIEVVRDPALHELLDQARRARGPAQGEIEVSGLKPRRLLARAEPLAAPPGGVLVVFYDVTDLRRLESMRRDFVANASHELRTPVTSIRSAAETLGTIPPGDTSARDRFVGIVERNAERLQQLVEDLLDLSKIESRELALASEPVSVRAVADRVAALHAERALGAGVELRVEVPAEHPKPRADARALEQILDNLVGNAIKYCPGEPVVVRARASEDRVFVEVRDRGPGIESRHLDRLFERFYRVDPGRSRALGGTGLGLAIVKHLAEAMGGAVGVESELGRGTTFTLELPRAELPLPELSTPRPEAVDGA